MFLICTAYQFLRKTFSTFNESVASFGLKSVVLVIMIIMKNTILMKNINSQLFESNIGVVVNFQEWSSM